MNIRVANILLLALVVALGVASCGGSDDEPALTKAQFIKQAEAICQKADKAQYRGLALADEDKGVPKGETPEEAIVTAALDPVQKQAEEIAELEPPEGDEEQIEAIVKGMEAGVRQGKEEGESAFTGGRDPFAEVDKLSGEYGFKNPCSEAL